MDVELLKKARTILGTALLTLGATLLFMNLWPSETPANHTLEVSYGLHDEVFFRTASQLFDAPLLEGNRIDTLLNGESLEAMLEAIRGARRSVTFETYIFWYDEVGERFVDAFVDRARAGVPVHLLLDWVGSEIDEDALAKMESAGVEVHRYHPPAWYHFDKLNNRTHRKILVVDGNVGFIGGVGVAEHWRGDASSPEEWRDTHFRVEGPVVAQLQAAFLDNWLKVHEKVLHGADYFPPLERRGDSIAQVMESSAEVGSESVRLAYLLAIAAARERILIANAYFVPGRLTENALLEARRRGVDIELIVPGRITDTPLLRRASRSGWGPLLEAGAEFYEYQPTMYHCKVMVVDDVWVVLGSSNFDNRSFTFNDEANLHVWDPEFARHQATIFERDRANSRRITLEEWRERPLREKIVGYLSSYFNPQL